MEISIQITSDSGNHKLTATLADNSSATAFYQLLEKGPVTIKMSDYGNFEKVGELPFSLVRNDEYITTSSGDVILYQGNQLTIYYDINSWNFTRVAKIRNAESTLKDKLGEGNIFVTLSLEQDKNV